ncbi:hypothetical protein [Sulfurovum sp.]|uniref:hypothetical protein n=1 Tax=Sulfurovum sp. TaxID=1969726 RepID=UPI0025E85126|nr:hypothetical protein [Sulfurovum sp.]
MDKSLLIFILVGLGFLYLITNFLGDIQKEDEKFQNKGYQQEHRYDQYHSVDSIGQEILNLVDADAKTQIEAWQASALKQEFLELFPDFADMKRFVKERIRGDALQTTLLKHIDTVEGKFFSGAMTAEQAKRSLDLLK